MAKNTTKAELEAQVAQLQAQIAQLLAATQPAAAPVAPATPVYNIPSTDVTLVYCSDALGYAKISNMELHFNRFGEEFVMSRSQFDELVGKYRAWFDRGILAVSYKNMDVAAAKGIRTDKEYALKYETLDSLGHMSVAQIEKVWNESTAKAHKEAIVSFYKRKFMEGAPGYTDRARVDLMNRLTDGGFNRECDELSGRYKISPTEM